MLVQCPTCCSVPHLLRRLEFDIVVQDWRLVGVDVPLCCRDNLNSDGKKPASGDQQSQADKLEVLRSTNGIVLHVVIKHTPVHS